MFVKRHLAVACLLFGVAAGSVEGSSITYEFSGNVSFASAGLAASNIPLNTLVTGAIVIDSATPDLDPSVNTSYGPMSSLVVKIAGYGTVSLGTTTQSTIRVGDSLSQDSFVAEALFDLAGPLLGGIAQPRFFQFALIDPTAAAFSTDALPLSLAGPFGLAGGSLTWVTDGGGGTFAASISFNNNLTYRVIAPAVDPIPAPEPATLVTLACGLLGTAIRQRRHRQRNDSN